MNIYLREAVEAAADVIEQIAVGAVTATDVTDSDTWGEPGDSVSMDDWMGVLAREVYADGRFTATTGWVVHEITVTVAVGGPSIGIVVDVLGSSARVVGRRATDTADVRLTDAATAAVLAAATWALGLP